MNPRMPSVHRRAPVGFDFTGRMRTLCHDIVARTPELGHVDLNHVAVAFAQARKGYTHGLQASLTPLRFSGGSTTTLRRGRQYSIQQLRDASGREMLYILSFYLPRFMETDLKEKLTTVFHELWHISPEFNGDLRRHDGRCYAHTHSQREYDERMWALAQRWLDETPSPEIYEFLHGSFQELQRRHGRVFGTKVRRPRLISVE